MITQQQAERLMDAVAAFDAATDYEQLAAVWQAAATSLVKCDHTILTHVHQHLAGKQQTHSPVIDELRRVAPRLHAHREDGPVYVARLRQVIEAAASIHSLTSEEAFERTALYNEALRPMGVYRQLQALSVGPAGLSVFLARGRGCPDFSAAEAWMIDQLTRRMSVAVDRLVRAGGGRLTVGGVATPVERFAWLVCNDEGVILRSTPEANRCLALCIGHDTPQRRIPAAWRDEIRRRKTGQPAHVFRFVRNGVRLSVHPVPIKASPGENSVGFIEYPGDAGPLVELVEMGLSRREAQVMRSAAQGKTNPQIAVELGISPLTVKKHMENVLHKLGVDSRTAATAKVLEKGR